MTTTAFPAQDLVFERSDELSAATHEQVVFCRDQSTGLKAVIAVHDTRLGPALGGTRFYPYASEKDALTDVLRLSQGMTHKAAAAGMALGGGKAVIIGDPDTLKTPELLRSYGRFVDRLGGLYYTAADVGTSADDLDLIGSSTRYVVGTNGGSGDSGYSTAYGVYCAMQEAARFIWGGDGLSGRTVGVEGVGKVGAHLVALLLAQGAHVVTADASAAALERLRSAHPDVQVADRVLDADVDVYAPCALGATLTNSSVADLRARLVCGAANNQLLDSTVAGALSALGITWVPDFVANAGGLIQVGGEIWQRTPGEVRRDVEKISDTVRTILTRTRETGLDTSLVAAQVVEERLTAGNPTFEGETKS